MIKGRKMSVNESIIKNKVSDRKTNFKNGLGEKEYSNLLRKQSRRRRSTSFEDSEVQVVTCPSCGSTEFFMDTIRSEKSCKKCGLVVEENIIDSTFRGTARDKDGNFHGQNGAPKNMAIHDGGLSTTFDVNKGHFNDKARWYRLRRLNNQARVSDPQSRNLARAFTELGVIVSNLSLSKDVRYESVNIYRNALDEDLIRGRSISKILVATVYIACRLCKVPRTLDEVEKATGINQKTISKNYRFLARKLGIKLTPISPNDYIPRFASRLGLSSQVEVRSIEIINDAKDLGLTSGKDPASVAAATLYGTSMLFGERKTQTEIAKTLGVTEVTIRNRFKELNSKLDFV